MTTIAAAGGAVYRYIEDRVEVLLIYRNGVWDLPKGKKEENETEEDCARREVAEETGIPLPEIKSFLVTTYHEYERKGTSFAKKTHWYSMQGTSDTNFTPQIEEGIEKVCWTNVKKAQQCVGYENLNEVLLALENYLSK